MADQLTAGLNNLREQVNRRFPNRDKRTDGTVGDTAHQGRTSGHNLDDTAGSKPAWDGDSDSKPEARAWDQDDDLNDPEIGSQDLVDHIVKLAGLGAVIRFIIFNGFWYHVRDGFKRQVYTGDNQHTDHVHYEGAWTNAADANTTFDFRLDELGDTVSQADVIAALKSKEGQLLIGAAVLGYDPGKNADGTYPKGSIRNLNTADAKANPTVGLAWAAGERSQTAVTLSQKIVDQCSAILAALGAVNTEVNQVPAETIALLVDESTPDEQVAQVLKGLLGDRLDSVVAYLTA